MERIVGWLLVLCAGMALLNNALGDLASNLEQGRLWWGGFIFATQIGIAVLVVRSVYRDRVR